MASTTLAQEFFTKFKSNRDDIAARLQSAPDATALQADIARLRKTLVDATEYLPTYDQRQYELQLAALEQDVQTLRAASGPKKTFGFKRKEGATRATPSIAAPVSAAATEPQTSTSSFDANSLTLSDQSGAYLTFSSLSGTVEPGAHANLTLSGIQTCVVNLVRPPAAVEFYSVHVRNLSDSVLILPRVGGSLLLHDCTRVVIVASCHQFRMHTTTGADVYLGAGSDPIIEHCTSVRFAPYILDDLPAPLPPVQDFDWLAPGHSPNWADLPSDERLARDSLPLEPLSQSVQLRETVGSLVRHLSAP